MTKVAIVVLNYNGLDDTLKCLASLRDVCARAHAFVVLVDNGSLVDPEPRAREVLPALQMVHCGTNLGYAGGNNRGIDVGLTTGAEFVLVLNNDTIVSPEIVERLVGAFETDDRLGIVGPIVNFMDEPGVVMTDGVAFNPGPGTEFFRRIEIGPSAPGTGRLTPVSIVNGCCMMIRASVLRRIGAFDERLFIVHEESDLCLRAARQGFTCAVLAETLVWHKGSSSFKRTGRQLQRYYDTRNLFYLLRRHTGRVGRSRGRTTTLGHYVRYAHYRHESERESACDNAAEAVIEGLCDALTGRTGPYRNRRRLLAPLVRSVFAAARIAARIRRSLGPAYQY